MRTDLVWRAVPAAAAAIALVLDAPQPVTGGLALVGLALSAERLVRLRSTDLGDRVLVGLGGIVVVLVLTGVVLGSTPVGLSPSTWVVALVVLSVLGLGVAAVLPAREAATGAGVTRADGRRALAILPWLAGAAVVTAVSVGMSASSLTTADRPPVQMSFGQVSGTAVEVVVSSSAAIGPLEVRTASGGDDLSYPLFSLDEDGSTTVTLSLPRTGRFVVTLSYPDQTQPLRTLILDR